MITFAATLRRSNRLPVPDRLRRAAQEAGLTGGRWLSASLPIPPGLPRGKAGPFFGLFLSLRTLRENLLLGVLALAGLLLASFAIGAGLRAASWKPAADVADGLLTVAEVTGGVAGLLLAVVVFGVQFHAERLGRVGFLVPFLSRREGLVPMAALAMAVIAANVIVGLSAPLAALPEAAAAMAAMDVLLVPAVLALTLRLLHRTVTGVGGDLFRDALLPVLRDAYARHLDKEVRELRLGQALSVELKRLDVESNRYFGIFEYMHDGWSEYPVPGAGRVRDVRLDRLEAAVELLRQAGAGRLVLNVGIGSDLGPRSLLLAQAASADGAKPGPLNLPPETADAVQAHLRRLFLTGEHHDDELPDLLTRLGESLPHVARHQDVDELERSLDVVAAVIRQRFEHPGLSDLDPHGRETLSSLPPYLSDTKWFDVAEAVAGTRDPAKVDVFLTAAARIFFDAAENRRPAAMRVFGQVIELVYRKLAPGGGELAAEVSRRLDGYLDATFTAVVARLISRTHEDVTGDVVRRLIPEYGAWVGWVLDLARAAIDAGRGEDAHDFTDRLRRMRLQVEQSADPARVPELVELADRLILGEVYLGGWCVGEMERRGNSAGPEREALNRLLDEEFPSREALLRAWERTPGADEGGGILHASMWERRERTRTGIAFTSGGARWPTRGLFAMLLAAKPEPSFHAARVLPSVPPDDVLPGEAVRAHLNHLLALPHLREALVRPDPARGEEAADAVAALFTQRRRSYRLDRLRRVIDAPISQPQVDRLREEAARAAAEEASFGRAVTRLGCAADSSGCAPPPSISGFFVQPKGLVVDGEAKHFSGYGENIGKRLTSLWDGQCVSAVEQAATPVTSAGAESQLPERLLAACDHLAAQGFRPNVVVIPRQERFAAPLFGTYPWQAAGRGEYGNDHLGRWRELEVFRCPYRDTGAAVVLDTRAVFGRSDAAAPLLVRVDVNDVDEHRRLLEVGEAAATDVAVPRDSDVRVTLAATYEGPLRLCEPRAAAKVTLDLGVLGYVSPPGSELYHRPGCPDAPGAGHTLGVFDQDRNVRRAPCPTCHPEEWDHPSWAT